MIRLTPRGYEIALLMLLVVISATQAVQSLYFELVPNVYLSTLSVGVIVILSYTLGKGIGSNQPEQQVAFNMQNRIIDAAMETMLTAGLKSEFKENLEKRNIGIEIEYDEDARGEEPEYSIEP